uniref:Cystatin n=1 Tax=Rhipicephalus appendiculatus TaxID=34631 RepID=A0A131YFC9_RHIAP
MTSNYSPGFTKNMTAADSALLLIGLLASFCTQSSEHGEWTDIQEPDDPDLRALAEFAFRQECWWPYHLKVHVLSARKQVVSGTRYLLLFTVKRWHKKMEKCTAIVWIPPLRKLQKRKVSTFKCK